MYYTLRRLLNYLTVRQYCNDINNNLIIINEKNFVCIQANKNIKYMHAVRTQSSHYINKML